MCSNKKLYRFLPFLLCLLLAACEPSSPANVASEESLAAAVQNEILARAEEMEVNDSDYETVAAAIEPINREIEIPVDPYAHISQDLYFERDNGRLNVSYISEGMHVEEGQLLAEIVFDQERLTAELESAQIELNEFNQSAAAEESTLFQEIDRIKNSVNDSTSGAEEERIALRAAQQDLAYRKLVFQNGLTRADYQKQIDELNDMLDGEQLYAPFDGVVMNVYNLPAGNVYRNYIPLCRVADDTSIQFRVNGLIDTVRYGDVFTVKSEQLGTEFQVKVVSDPIATNTREGQYQYVLTPTEGKSAWDIFASLGIENLSDLYSHNLVGYPTAFDAGAVLVVPNISVQSEDSKQFVRVYENGSIKKRYVVTGLSQSGMIQILSGLEPGQMVVLNN